MIACSLLFFSLMADPGPANPVKDPEVVTTVTDTDGTQGIQASFVVQATADDVAQMIWVGNTVRQMFPQVKERKDVPSSDGDLLADYVVEGVTSDLKYRLRFHRERQANGATVIKWNKVSGDMGIIRGTWRITPLNAGACRVEYTSFATMGPAFLQGFVRDGMAKSTKGIAERTRKVIRPAAPAAP